MEQKTPKQKNNQHPLKTKMALPTLQKTTAHQTRKKQTNHLLQQKNEKMKNNQDTEPEMPIDHEGYYSGLVSAGFIMLIIDAILVLLVIFK